jgi:hypothetical protein
MHSGRVFQQTVGIPMSTNCTPLLPDLFLYWYVWCRLHTRASQEKQKKLARSFNFTFRYIDDVLSLNNSRFGDFVDRINPIELEIKDTTNTDMSDSYLDLHLEIGSLWRSRTKHYIQRDDFNFQIVNFPFMSSSITAAYGEYISQLIWYSRAYGSYYDFLDRRVLLTGNILNQWFHLIKLKSSLRKFYGLHHDFVFTVVEYLCHKCARICSSFMTSQG